MWQLTFLEFPTIVLVKQVTRPKDLKSFAKSFLDFILTSLLVRYQGIYDRQNLNRKITTKAGNIYVGNFSQ